MSIVREFEKAFNRQDVEALVACFAPGGSYVDTFFGAHTGTAALRVYRAANALVSPLTLLRALVGLGVAALAARFLVPPGKLFTLVGAAITPCVYLVILLLTRELGRADLDMIRRVIKR